MEARLVVQVDLTVSPFGGNYYPELYSTKRTEQYLGTLFQL